MHEIEVFWDNIVHAWVMTCCCGDLGNWNYGLLLEDLGRQADLHMADDTARFVAGTK